MKSYYIISSEVADSWMLDDIRFIKAWIDLQRLCHIGDNPRTIIRHGISVEVTKFQVATSASELAARWGMCRQSVEKFLARCVRDGLISDNFVNNKIRILTILLPSSYDYAINSTVNSRINSTVNSRINSTINSTLKEEEKKSPLASPLNKEEENKKEEKFTGEISAYVCTREEAETYFPSGKSVMGDRTACATIDEYVDAMRHKSRQWQESVMMQLCIDQSSLNRLLDEFLLNCKTTAEPTHITLGKAKGHFVRWATRIINRAKPLNNGNTNKSSIVDYAERQLLNALNKQR